ncbi:ATP-binding response regulator [Pseudoduganella albidiflava]|nr:hybrid sensor histidine kinase/response regulator [Pseudoduganella albidiflava]GGY35845.1 hybrid sensor histidine kinase/response regulator [Pseudoduganella albidiflava]
MDWHAAFRFAPLPREVECKQIEIVFEGSIKSLVASLIAMILIVGGILLISSTGTPMPGWAWISLAIWASLITAFSIRGILIVRRYLKIKPDLDSTRAWGRRLAINDGLVLGILWGSLGFVVMGLRSEHHVTFAIAALALVTMAGAGSKGPWRPIAVLFVISTTSVFSIALLVQSSANPILAAGFLLYAFTSLAFARQHQHVVRRIIDLNIENEHLLKTARESMLALEEAKMAADQANLAKSRFLAAVSHDLRQPMHAISLYLAYLRSIVSDEVARAAVDKVEGAAGAMEELLSVVLDLSKVSLGAVQPAEKVFDFRRMCEELDLQLAPPAAEKGLELAFSAEHIMLRTDPVLLERIVRNLLLNAIRYTNEGLVRVHATTHNGVAMIHIADTGVGIKLEERERVFEEFYQVNNPERDRTKGMGLGLAIVKQLCQVLGITIRLKSQLGKGTVVRLSVPGVAAPASGLGPDESAQECLPDCLSGATVLVIEDDPLVLDSMELVLASFGCHVLSSTNGAQALERIAAGERVPDIIISDYRLPNGETGIDAVHLVRHRLHESFDIEPMTPAVLITGNTSPEELAHAMHYKLPVLYKPVGGAALRRTLSSLIDAYRRELIS